MTDQILFDASNIKNLAVLCEKALAECVRLRQEVRAEALAKHWACVLNHLNNGREVTGEVTLRKDDRREKVEFKILSVGSTGISVRVFAKWVYQPRKMDYKAVRIGEEILYMPFEAVSTLEVDFRSEWEKYIDFNPTGCEKMYYENS